jgi:hypothetical protein
MKSFLLAGAALMLFVGADLSAAEAQTNPPVRWDASQATAQGSARGCERGCAIRPVRISVPLRRVAASSSLGAAGLSCPVTSE